MYISKRQFVKQAIQVPAFINKIKAKYPNSEQDPEFGKIINQFFQYKNIKPLNNESPELVAILNELPSNWNEAKEYMKSEINSLAANSQPNQEKKIKPISSDEIKQSLVELGLAEEDLIKKEIRDWLYSRFVEKNKEEMHDIADSLITLKKYSDNKSNIINKANRDQEFVQQLSGKGISTDKISNMQELSVDDMEFILEKYDDNKETSINTTNVEIKPEEFVGKVGKWNIWLPSSQETSAKIAGYDEETKQPKTTWCTARTRGSNLFYHYISRDQSIYFLFYIIRDNPSEDNDWLSLGFTGYSNNGLESIKPYYGGNGGITVNKANKGLEESDFDSILGENKEEIFSLIKKKINDLGGENPATEELKKYANNFELFKAELNKKNIDNKKDFCEIILGLNPNKEVKKLAKIWTLSYKAIIKNKDNPNIAPFIDSILKKLAEEKPSEFLKDYRKEPWAQEYIPLAAKKIAEKYPYLFKDFRNEPWAEEYIPLAVKIMIEKYPYNFLEDYRKEPWAQKYIPLAAKKLIEKYPYLFKDFRNEPWAQKFIPLLVKIMIEKYPYNFLKDYRKEPWAQEYIPLAAKKFAEDNPSDFLSHFSNKPWAQEPREELGGKSLIDLAMEQKKIASLVKSLNILGFNKEASLVYKLICQF